MRAPTTRRIVVLLKLPLNVLVGSAPRNSNDGLVQPNHVLLQTGPLYVTMPSVAFRFASSVAQGQIQLLVGQDLAAVQDLGRVVLEDQMRELVERDLHLLPESDHLHEVGAGP